MREVLFPLIIFVLMLWLTACGARRYVTTETVWPGDPDYYVVVEFPVGVSIDDSLTTMMDNHLVLTAKVPTAVLDGVIDK